MGDVPRRINVRGQSGVSSNLRVCTLDAGSKCVPVSKEKRPILDKFAGSRLGFGGRRSRVVRDNLAGRGIRILPDPNHWRNMVGELCVERKLDFSLIRINSILENLEKLPSDRDHLYCGLGRLDCSGFSPGLHVWGPRGPCNEFESEDFVFRPFLVSDDFQE